MQVDLAVGRPSFERLNTALAGAKVDARIPENFEAITHDGEDETVNQRRDRSSGWITSIRYRDEKGQISNRIVTCRQITGFGALTNVRAYCWERQALREFKICNMLEVVDPYTGEDFPSPEEKFRALQYSGILNCEDRALTELAKVLVFIAGCDGHVHAAEIDAITEQLNEYAFKFGADHKMVEAAMFGCDYLAPDSGDLLRSVKRFSKAQQKQKLCRFLLESTAAVIEADGRQDAAEMRWAVEMSSLLKAVCDCA